MWPIVPQARAAPPNNEMELTRSAWLTRAALAAHLGVRRTLAGERMLRDPRLRRRLLKIGIVVCGWACVGFGLNGLVDTGSVDDRRAVRAFSRWRDSPTVENERALHAARDAVMRSAAESRRMSFGLALGFGIGAWLCYRGLGGNAGATSLPPTPGPPETG